MSTPQPNRLSNEEVRRVAQLCRLGLSEAEVERLGAEMAGLLSEVDVLRAIDTSNVEPTGHAVEDVHTVMREDTTEEPLALSDVLFNAPEQQGDYFRVRAVME